MSSELISVLRIKIRHLIYYWETTLHLIKLKDIFFYYLFLYLCIQPPSNSLHINSTLLLYLHFNDFTLQRHEICDWFSVFSNAPQKRRNFLQVTKALLHHSVASVLLLLATISSASCVTQSGFKLLNVNSNGKKGRYLFSQKAKLPTQNVIYVTCTCAQKQNLLYLWYEILKCKLVKYLLLFLALSERENQRNTGPFF